MIKGVGPQRAELLAQRGIYTLEDLLGYSLRYEDRIHFSKVKDIQPNARIPFARRHERPGGAQHARPRRHLSLLVQDDAGGSLLASFSTEAISKAV